MLRVFLVFSRLYRKIYILPILILLVKVINMKKIQTELKEGWTDCEHKNWAEIVQDGWQFVGLDNEGCVVMTRKGYFNRFRQVN